MPITLRRIIPRRQRDFASLSQLYQIDRRLHSAYRQPQPAVEALGDRRGSWAGQGSRRSIRDPSYPRGRARSPMAFSVCLRACWARFLAPSIQRDGMRRETDCPWLEPIEFGLPKAKGDLFEGRRIGRIAIFD